jgi:hypothetical protein
MLWKIALCSLSTGISFTPRPATFCMTMSTGHDQRLFVGQGDIFPGIDGCQGRCQPGRPHHGTQHRVGFSTGRCLDIQPASPKTISTSIVVGSSAFNCSGVVGVDHGGQAGCELNNLSGTALPPGSSP